MNNLIITMSLIFLSGLTEASSVQFGRVVDIKGSGFISFEGKTHEIKKGEILHTNSEIVIEHAGQVTFTDNADHRFYLGNGSSAVIKAGKVELRSGDLWVQSLNKMDEYTLTSANAVVHYQGGEAILSYDSNKGRTQLMVINGLMKFSNLRAPELNLTVAEGNFSFVDLNFEEGMPRDPTPVGEKTFSQLISLFPGVTPMDKGSVNIFKDKKVSHQNAREIASVETELGLEKKYKEEMLKLQKTTKVKMKKAAVVSEQTPAPMPLTVKIYGQSRAHEGSSMAIYDVSPSGDRAVSSKRAPASAEESVLDQAVPNDNSINPQYKESEKLIEQLKKL